MLKIKFKIGFWHPFGSHGGETKDEIIKRKQYEIKNNNGWTLWSFQKRREETLKQWLNEIKKCKGRIFVLCSDSDGGKDPIGKKFYAKAFLNFLSENWQFMPKKVKIPHPFGKRNFACAFKVKKIYKPEDLKIPLDIKWFRVYSMTWQETKLPTRGEFLIKAGGNSKRRAVCAVLELAYPYVVIIKK